jgi:protein phosphatase
MPKRIRFGIKTDIGQARMNNQDAVFALATHSASAFNQPSFGVFVVADGMGGHEHGEIASAIAARVVADHIQRTLLIPMLAGSPVEDVLEILETAVQKANENIQGEVPDGGTTITFAVLVDNRAYLGQVGDSRAYIISGGKIEQITRSHTLVDRLIELGQLTKEEVNSPNVNVKNVLYRALGQGEVLEVDTLTRQLKNDDYLLLCSDGLWNLVQDEDLQKIVVEASNPQEACDTLVSLANEKGGHDNISVIVVRVGEDK